VVHGLGIVHFVEVGHRLHRKKNQLLVGVPVGWLQGEVLAQGFGFQFQVRVRHLFPFTRFQVVGLRIKHLRRHSTVVLAVEVQDTGRFLCLLLAELLRTERTWVFHQIVCLIPRWIPGHVEEEGNGVFHGLEVTHIQYPQFIHPIIIR